MAESPGDFAALLTQARGGDRSGSNYSFANTSRTRLVARCSVPPTPLSRFDGPVQWSIAVCYGLRNQRFTFDKPDDVWALALKLSRRKAPTMRRPGKRQQRLSGDGNAATDVVELLACLASHDEPACIAQSRDRSHDSLPIAQRRRTRLLQPRIEGYEPTEIAEKLRLSAVAFRVRLTRLRSRLQSAGVFDDCCDTIAKQMRTALRSFWCNVPSGRPEGHGGSACYDAAGVCFLTLGREHSWLHPNSPDN